MWFVITEMNRTLSDIHMIDDRDSQKRDRFSVWRDTDDIGYVMLAFAIIIEAVKDLCYGEYIDYLNAASFWKGEEFLDDDLESYYSSVYLWLSVLGMNDIPDIVDDLLNERRSLDEKVDPEFCDTVARYIAELEYYYQNMKIDFLYTNLEK